MAATRKLPAWTALLTAALLLVLLRGASVEAAIPADDAAAAAIKRVLTLLNVTSGEYREGVVDGEIALQIEYDEARAFAQEAEQRLQHALGPQAQPFAAPFSTLRSAIEAKADSAEVRKQTDALRAAITKETGISEDVYPAMPPSASRGRALFTSNCVSCHGTNADGRGESAEGLDPPPANFTDREFMHGVAPFDVFNIIAVGRAGSAMPSWEDVLSIQDRWDVVSYLWTVHPGRTRLAEGQGIFQTQCAGCHGTTADGRGALSASLLKPAAALNSVSALAEKTDTELFDIVTKGIAGTPMPGFATVLSEEQRWAAVSFLRLLAFGGDDGSKEAPDVNDADARHFAGLLGLLSGEYGKAMGGATVSEVDYRESKILSDLISRRADRAMTTLASHAPDQTEAVRQNVARIVAIVAARGSAKELGTLAAQTAHTIESAVPAEGAADSADALAETKRLLDDALAAYRTGDARATYLVSDAYFQFEPFEAKLNATAPAIRSRIESRFLELRGIFAKPGGTADAEAVVAAIATDLDAARAATSSNTNAYAIFTQSAMIILREGFEIVLVVGALLAYVSKAGTPPMRTAILSGTGLGIVVSLIGAYLLTLLLRSTVVVAEVVEGLTLLLASVVLFSVSYWLISKAEAEKWQRYIQGRVKSAMGRGSMIALAGAAFLAVFREGIETVLFYQALLAGAGSNTGPAIAGFGAGCAALAVVYVLFQRFGKRMPIRQFFLLTGALLYYLSFVFAGRGVAALQQIGWLSTTTIPGLPTIALLGFHPTAETLIAQGILFACLLYALFATWRDQPRESEKLDAKSAA